MIVIIEYGYMKYNKYFSIIDSHDKAYWLGFIMADGCIIYNKSQGNYYLQIALKEEDSHHLGILMGYVSPRQETPRHETVSLFGKTYHTCKVTWYSKEMVEDLINHGITPQKTNREKIPPLDAQFESSFWRGYFDGDGGIHRKYKVDKKDEFQIQLCGSEAILKSFQKWALRCANMNPQKIRKAKNQHGETNIHVFFCSGNRQVLRVLHAMYSIKGPSLKRKRNKYLELVTLSPKVFSALQTCEQSKG
jgi:hypothetical protein